MKQSYYSLFLFVAMQKEKVNRKRKTCLSKAMLLALQDQMEILKSKAFQLFARYCALHTLAFLLPDY